jgi:hypothetical protein
LGQHDGAPGGHVDDGAPGGQLDSAAGRDRTSGHRAGA